MEKIINNKLDSSIPTVFLKNQYEIKIKKDIILYDIGKSENDEINLNDENNSGLLSVNIKKMSMPKWKNGKWKNFTINFYDTVGKSTSQIFYHLTENIRNFDYYKKNKNSLMILEITKFSYDGIVTSKWEIGVDRFINIDFGELDYSSSKNNIITIKFKPSFVVQIY